MIRIHIGWVVMKNGDPVRTVSTSPMHKSAKLYSKEGNAKAVASKYDAVVWEAFIEVNPA